MKSLVVEDEFTSRRILQHHLAAHGDCHIAVNGKEAISAFKEAYECGRGYELVCLDIMLPGLDGHDVLQRIRAFEASQAVPIGAGAKVIMTSSLSNPNNIMSAFKTGCEAYLVKPITKDKIVGQLDKLGLLQAA